MHTGTVDAWIVYIASQQPFLSVCKLYDSRGKKDSIQTASHFSLLVLKKSECTNCSTRYIYTLTYIHTHMYIYINIPMCIYLCMCMYGIERNG